MSAKLKLVMLVFNKINKNQINKVIIFVICLILGFGFAKIYQPQGKTERLYKQALKDYQNENYQNSYYLFSKNRLYVIIKTVGNLSSGNVRKGFG